MCNEQAVAAPAETAIDCSPIQAPASLNLQAVKDKIDEVIKGPEGQ